MVSGTLFVYLDNDKIAGAVLDSAVTIACAHKSHIIGMAVTVNYPVYADLAVGIPTNVLHEMNAPARERVASLKQAFNQKLAQFQGTSEWRNPSTFYANAAELVVHDARACDLIVCGKDSTSELNGTGAVSVETLALQAGRPVLVVPSHKPFAMPKRAAIAWNNTREASRALFDALPLLKSAEDVSVMTFIDGEGERDAATVAGQSLVETLRRHGIAARAKIEHVAGNSASDALMNRLTDEFRDFLVMGCYGRSRFSEMLFGGMSRDMLSYVTVPTLMSH